MEFTKDEIMTAIFCHHKKVYGYVGKEENSEDVPRDGYFIAGFVTDALNHFEAEKKNAQKGWYCINDDTKESDKYCAAQCSQCGILEQDI